MATSEYRKRADWRARGLHLAAAVFAVASLISPNLRSTATPLAQAAGVARPHASSSVQGHTPTRAASTLARPHASASGLAGTAWSWGDNANGQVGAGSVTSNAPSGLQVAAAVVGLPASDAVASVAGGYQHSVAVTVSGKVYTWGYNGYGQLGNGTTSDSATAVAVQGLPSGDAVVSVAAGQYDSLALTASGKVYAWGYNGDGELGNGTTTNSTTAGAVLGLPGGDAVVGISAGYQHGLAVTQSGAVYAWGLNGNGQVGNGTTTNSTAPMLVGGLPSGDPVVSVAGGQLYSLALTQSGKVYSWGYDGNGELGNGTTAGAVTSAVAVGGLPGSDPVAVIAAGANHAVVATASGAVYAWGYNNYGQVGNNSTSSVTSAVAVGGLPGSDPVVSVAGGYRHSAAVTASGKVYAWGYNGYGQVGNGTTTNSAVPVAVLGLPGGPGRALVVVAGGYHTVTLVGTSVRASATAAAGSATAGAGASATAVAATATAGSGVSTAAWAWGYNNAGQVGNGTVAGASPSGVLYPNVVQGLPSSDSVLSVVGAEQFSLALTASGKVWAWGYNGEGELGNGTTTNSALPVAVVGLPGGDPVVAISAQYRHSLALTASGKVYAWGYNAYDQLGNGTATNSAVPVPVQGLPGGDPVVAIVAGTDHSEALTVSGRVYAWGYNYDGELGIGSYTQGSTAATQGQSAASLVLGLPSGDPVVKLAVGGYHTLALTASGKLYAWGYNGYGQLGNNSTSNSASAILVQGLLGGDAVVALAAGYYHSVIATASGKVYSWGQNNYGQLGTNSTSNGSLPVAVVGLPSGDAVTQLSGGEYHTLAATASGKVYAWGLNSNGQLGQGNTTNSVVAEPVKGLPSSALVRPVVLGAGWNHNLLLLNTLSAAAGTAVAATSAAGTSAAATAIQGSTATSIAAATGTSAAATAAVATQTAASFTGPTQTAAAAAAATATAQTGAVQTAVAAAQTADNQTVAAGQTSAAGTAAGTATSIAATAAAQTRAAGTAAAATTVAQTSVAATSVAASGTAAAVASATAQAAGAQTAVAGLQTSAAQTAAAQTANAVATAVGTAAIQTSAAQTAAAAQTATAQVGAVQTAVAAAQTGVAQTSAAQTSAAGTAAALGNSATQTAAAQTQAPLQTSAAATAATATSAAATSAAATSAAQTSAAQTAAIQTSAAQTAAAAQTATAQVGAVQTAVAAAQTSAAQTVLAAETAAAQTTLAGATSTATATATPQPGDLTATVAAGQTSVAATAAAATDAAGATATAQVGAVQTAVVAAQTSAVQTVLAAQTSAAQTAAAQTAAAQTAEGLGNSATQTSVALTQEPLQTAAAATAAQQTADAQTAAAATAAQQTTDAQTAATATAAQQTTDAQTAVAQATSAAATAAQQTTDAQTAQAAVANVTATAQTAAFQTAVAAAQTSAAQTAAAATAAQQTTDAQTAVAAAQTSAAATAAAMGNSATQTAVAQTAAAATAAQQTSDAGTAAAQTSVAQTAAAQTAIAAQTAAAQTVSALLTSIALTASAPTQTPTSTGTATPVDTVTSTSIPTVTATETAVPTSTSSPTGTATTTATVTDTPTGTATAIPTSTSTGTETTTPTGTTTPRATTTGTATVTATPTASIVINPMTGTYRTSVTVSGTNFAPNEAIALFWDNPAIPGANATADASGAFHTTLSISVLSYGPHTLSAAGQTSGRLALATFTMQPALALGATSARANTSDVLAGVGFGASETVLAHFGSVTGTVIGATRTTTGTYPGYFSGYNAITFTVPLVPTGTYQLAAVGQTTGATAIISLTILSSLTVSPTSGGTGAIRLTGAAFLPSEQVTVRGGCKSVADCTSFPSVAVGTVNTNSQGTFALTATIPATIPIGSTYLFNARDATGNVAIIGYSVTGKVATLARGATAATLKPPTAFKGLVSCAASPTSSSKPHISRHRAVPSKAQCSAKTKSTYISHAKAHITPRIEERGADPQRGRDSPSRRTPAIDNPQAIPYRRIVGDEIKQAQ